MVYQIIDAAEADGVIRCNPVRYTTFRADDSESQKDAFTIAEIERLIGTEHSKMKDFSILVCFTGVRTRELLALRGMDVAQSGVSITVSRAANMDGNVPHIGLTKSRESNRVIPAPACVQDIAAKYGDYGERLIWQSPKKKDVPSTPVLIATVLRDFAKGRDPMPHTTLLSAHLHYTAARTRSGYEYHQALAGHSRKDVTEGYTHLNWKTLSAAANRLKDLFGLQLSA